MLGHLWSNVLQEMFSPTHSCMFVSVKLNTWSWNTALTPSLLPQFNKCNKWHFNKCRHIQQNLHLWFQIPTLMKDEKKHVPSTSRLSEHVERLTLGVSARLWQMSAQQTKLPLMLSQDHRNLCWPWALFCMISTELSLLFWLALLHFVSELSQLHVPSSYQKETSKSVSWDAE